MNWDLTISIVLYKSNPIQLKETLDSVLQTHLNLQVYVVDNSPTQDLKKEIPKDPNVVYMWTGKNLGFGAAHNLILLDRKKRGPFHLILNPDIYFEDGTLQKLLAFLKENPQVGMVVPKIKYPDGRLQHNCRLLPSPEDWIFRRFSPLRKRVKNRNQRYELQVSGYNRTMNIPYFLGCFMLLRSEAIDQVGGFDEKIFLYGEDTDLTRRMHNTFQTLFYPHALAYHHYQRGSYKSLNLLAIHMRSAIYYFNKWGWWNDQDRKRVNAQVLKEVQANRLEDEKN